jgi:hypothetical protein
MIKLIDLLNEKKSTLPKNKWTSLSSSEVSKYEKEIFDLVQNAYKPIGGHPNFKSKSDVKSGADEYVVIDLDSDDEIDALSGIKKGTGGKKFVATGHDGERSSKSAAINHKVDKLKKRGHYIEVSGKMEDILRGKGLTPITDEETIRKVLKGKDIEWLGDGYYKRKIGSATFTKIMFGKPNV